VNYDTEAKLNYLTARITVARNGKEKDGELIGKNMIRRQLAEYLAQEVVASALVVKEEIYSTLYEVRLIVLTSDQLEKYVARRARDYGYIPQVTEHFGVTKE
jgi:hypothetical protein